MKPSLSADTQGRHRLLAAAGAIAVLLLLVGVGAYGLLAGPRSPDAAPTATASTNGKAPTLPAPSIRTPGLPTIPDTDDPELFARRVAEALFTWDTASGLTPRDYTSIILDTADPTGEEQAGLASDLAGYLPPDEAWSELRRYATRQSLTIDQIVIPAAWSDAQAQAQPGQIPAGTVAFTIDGTRTRTGAWNNEPVAAQRPVAFTVFVACPPRDDTCHLLRLSALDDPLR